MHFNAGHLIFTPSDLTQFMESPFASWMEHLALTNPEQVPIPDEPDAMMSVLQQKGHEHELAVLAAFEEKGLNIQKPQEETNPMEATSQAMQMGVDIIYQAHLCQPPLMGVADFLVKVPGMSQLGDYYYEIWDTKLSKTVKPSFLIQLCCYAELLRSLQNRLPDNIVVLSGDGDERRFRTNDYFFYYQNLKKQFFHAHEHFHVKRCPDPAASSNWGRWRHFAESLLVKMDHLAQVATITASQIKKLNQAGIMTMSGLTTAAATQRHGLSPTVFERLKAQAIIQKQSAGHTIPKYKILPHQSEKKQGLTLLPPASPQDLFFDIEGYPLQEGGLEYLWGVTYFNAKGERLFKDFWAHNHAEEKKAFEDFIAWAYQRWQHDPSMHIYHYANYEVAACRKLMGQYGTCEYEVDQLLRHEVFVDLYKIVKGALIVGEPRYSIKNIEHLYRPQRDTEVGSGGDSVVEYERWREHPDGDDWETSVILKNLRDYNMDDCNSTQELAEWLRRRQKEHDIAYAASAVVSEPVIKEDANEAMTLRDSLLKRADDFFDASKPVEAKQYALFAWCLEFHRREAKPVFWRLFDRLGLSDDELSADLDCLSHCEPTDTAPYKFTPRAKNLSYEYRFDSNQEFKAASSRYYVLGQQTPDGKPMTVSLNKEASDFQQGKIVLSMKDATKGSVTLIPDEYVNPDPMPAAILKQASRLIEGTLEPSAIIDFLSKSTPRIKGHTVGKPIVSSHESKKRLNQISQAVSNLDKSYLIIQGPPGAGKTYTGKHVIAQLVKKGMKVGISSNSHKAINNLLISTAMYCAEEQIEGLFACTKDTDEVLERLGVDIIKNNQIIETLQPGCVVGTTAWGFARDELEGAFDYLFIDEAGQVSVANLIAMSQAADNIILMGDQMQLGQPSKGSHPDDSGLSVLDYMLHATPTIPEHQGVFLGTTYRLHPDVNAFISEAIYQGKLLSAPDNARQRIDVPPSDSGIRLKKAGIVTIPVPHEGNTQASDEEVCEIKKQALSLIGCDFHAKNGEIRKIGWQDILFVAPYNHQVNKLKDALGPKAFVGSVDKFQGQEAPIVFLSMCTSNPADSPRGISFVFDKHRINVAISRAQCLAIVVYSPSLLALPASNVEQLESMNIFCRLVDFGTPH